MHVLYRVIQDMYEGVTTSAQTTRGKNKVFHIEIGLHQGLALSCYLFNLVLDVLIIDIQKIIPNCMLLADDIVFIKESKEAINIKLELRNKRALLAVGL